MYLVSKNYFKFKINQDEIIIKDVEWQIANNIIFMRVQII